MFLHWHQPQGFHKDINPGPVNLSTIHNNLSISYEKVLFAFHYNYIDLHVVISPLAHSY